jgi:hypothetical protein
MRKIERNNCIICGNKTKRHTTKTCSLICRDIAQIKNSEKECLNCKAIFKPSNKDSKYCSLECSYTSPCRKEFSKEHKRKISNFAKTRIGKLNPMYGRKAAHGKGSWHISFESKRFFLRSSWELAFAKYLDSKKIKYEVENKRFPIKYTYEGIEKEGTYCPDFYLPEKDKYYEIKGWWRDDAKSKYDAFNSQYPDIKNILITSAFLKKLNLKDVRLK